MVAADPDHASKMRGAPCSVDCRMLLVASNIGDDRVCALADINASSLAPFRQLKGPRLTLHRSFVSQEAPRLLASACFLEELILQCLSLVWCQICPWLVNGCLVPQDTGCQNFVNEERLNRINRRRRPQSRQREGSLRMAGGQGQDKTVCELALFFVLGLGLH